MVALGADVNSSFKECVIVYLEGTDTVPIAVMSVAEQVTGLIFHEIGVAVHWSTDPRQQLPESCTTVGMKFDEASKSRSGTDAMGYALPYSKGRLQVHIMIERILWQCRFACFDSSTRMRERALLGHVMAHEIGHVLQGIVHHAGDGVMKANWTYEEVLEMEARRLSFTKSDANLIHLGFLRGHEIERQESYRSGQAPDKR